MGPSRNNRRAVGLDKILLRVSGGIHIGCFVTLRMGTISHNGKRSPTDQGRTVFDYADAMSVRVATSCGRTGSCHECVVEILGGGEGLSPRNGAESFLSGPYRLACQATIEDAAADIVFAPLRRRPRILTEAMGRPSGRDPMVRREGDRVYYDEEEVDRFRGHVYGLAVDLGTTTVVADLMDLETGRSVCLTAFENPQRFGGSDVMNRISYDGGPNHGELWKAATSMLNAEIEAMCERFGFCRQEIYEVVVAGNSTMRDLLFRLDVQPIGQKPYKSTTERAMLDGQTPTTALTRSTRRLGIRVNPKGRVYGLPLIASHVGADTSADLVATDFAKADGVWMLVDVGTNTEVVIGDGTRLYAASAPAGPAFEGGGIRFGMPGCDGAIETVTLEKGPPPRFHVRTIGDAPPEGICGSGLIDLLAELRRSGMMSEKGVFEDRQKEIPVVPGITFSREDASALAQAKAANTCGQQLLMRRFGVGPSGVDRLFLAGGFANYVNVRNAIEIGFLAPVPEERIVKVGNASLQGAREVLMSRTKRAEVEALVKRIEHVELETMSDFFDVFVDGCQFKPFAG